MSMEHDLKCTKWKRAVHTSKIEEFEGEKLTEDSEYKFMDHYESTIRGIPELIKTHERKVYYFNSYVEASKKKRELSGR